MLAFQMHLILTAVSVFLTCSHQNRFFLDWLVLALNFVGVAMPTPAVPAVPKQTQASAQLVYIMATSFFARCVLIESHCCLFFVLVCASPALGAAWRQSVHHANSKRLARRVAARR